MARRRRKKHSGTWPAFIVLSLVIIAGWWWLIRSPGTEPGMNTTGERGQRLALTTNRPETPPAVVPQTAVSEKGASDEAKAPGKPKPPDADRIRSLVKAGKQAVARSELVAARAHFSEAMVLGAAGEEAALLQAELTRIGNETIFSQRMFEHDPFVERYIIQPGATLAKIASKNKVTPDLLANINNIRNKHLIRAGQTIKLVKGPFHAVVDRSAFSLDVYLDNTFVRHYRVGLGADGSTPGGEWRVGTKLTNPTYYPPRGGRIIAADDPQNPLGERWIGLVGVGGEALGQERYGIHGTIEPESIGQETSLGCIRMYNEDVEELYTLLVEKYSTVTIK